MKKFIAIVNTFVLFAFNSLIFSSNVWADDNPPQLTTSTNGSPTVGGILDSALKILFPIAGVVCVIFLIIGGYMWMTSTGDPEKIKKAQSTLTWALIGLVFIMLCTSILYIVTKFIYSA